MVTINNLTIRNNLFDQLKKWSGKKTSFSIRDFADEIAMPYKSILALCKDNKDWKFQFDKARNHLACNAENALNSGLISTCEGLRYLYENDFFLKESMRAAGKNIPDDPDDFDEWVLKQLVSDLEDINRSKKIKR